MDFYKLALLGHPLGHSRSPEMHKRALAHCNLQGSYELIDVPETELASTVQRLKDEGYAGFNVTIPYKEKIISLLDDVEVHTKSIGAVNTVRIDEQTNAVGFNTDAPAFLRSLLSKAGDSNKFRSAVILGNGGASRAARSVLKSISPNINIIVVSRKANIEWTESLRPFECLELSHFIDQKAFDRNGPNLFINATPLGQSNATTPEFKYFERIISKFPDGTFVFDMVYAKKKSATTPFVSAAQKRGFKCCDGTYMLALQAAGAFYIWTGKLVTPEVMLGL